MRYKRSSSTLVFTGYLYPRASPHKRRDTDHKKQDFGACYAHVRSVIYKEGERGGAEREGEREGGGGKYDLGVVPSLPWNPAHCSFARRNLVGF